MVNIAICDDNTNVLNKLSDMIKIILGKNSFDGQVVLSTSNYNEILNLVDSNKVNVLFLDIDLNNSNSGLDIAKMVRKKNKDIYIIFLTGHLEYAMVAYKYKTFDFLAKPVTASRLEDTIIRLFDDIKETPKKYIKVDNKNTIVDENTVECISRDGMKLVFHSSLEDIETYSSFKKLDTHLSCNFVRCHKSHIANINLIRAIDPVINKITFMDGFTCDIGPKYKKNFMEVVNDVGNVL